jgi:signal transduction histidine kinase
MTHRLLSIPLLAFIGLLLFSLGGTIALSLMVFQLNITAIQRLVLMMAGSGILTTLTGLGLYRLGVFGWLPSIFWTIGIIVLTTTGIVMLNIWMLTQAMFISSAYLSVTSSVLLFAGLTALGVGYFITRSMTDRLRTLSEGAERIARGDLSTRVEVQGRDEISRLTQSFNAMAKDLQAVDEEKAKLELTRRNLVAWVSHDLRTPLASMRLMLEALVDNIVPDEETQKRYLDNTLNEIHNLDQLIDSLFELAQLDIKDIQLDYMTFSLSELLSDIVSSASAKLERKQISLNCTIHPEADIVTAAPDKIQRVLMNLLDNAIKYTPSGQSIAVRTSPTPEGTQVIVTNTGITIPPEQLPKLFESFYRGESSRTQTDGERGAGLGLAIARGFVEAHSGRIWATSRNDETSITFTIPHQQ